MNLLWAVLNALLSIGLAIYAAYLSTNNPKHRLRLVVLGTLSGFVAVVVSYKAYSVEKQSRLDNLEAASKQSLALQDTRSLQTTVISLQGLLQGYISKEDLRRTQITRNTSGKRVQAIETRDGIYFKDSPLFTQETKQFIRATVKKFRQYLEKLDIPVPSETAPFGVSEGIKWKIKSANVSYLGEIMLGPESLHDATAITEAYSAFVIQEILNSNRLKSSSLLLSKDSTILAHYYSWSFWNKQSDEGNTPWLPALWQMREKFGPEFTDSMVAFTLKIIRDNPHDDTGQDFDTYFSERLKGGEAVLDNGGKKRQELDAILSTAGLTIAHNN